MEKEKAIEMLESFKESVEDTIKFEKDKVFKEGLKEKKEALDVAIKMMKEG